jgi:putative transposase
MPEKCYSPGQIINSLREAEVLLSQGSTAAQAARHLGIIQQTYYRCCLCYSKTTPLFQLKSTH